MPSDVAFSTVLRDNLRSEVDSDAISGVTGGYVGVDNLVNLMILGQTVLGIFEPLTL